MNFWKRLFGGKSQREKDQAAAVTTAQPAEPAPATTEAPKRSFSLAPDDRNILFEAFLEFETGKLEPHDPSSGYHYRKSLAERGLIKLTTVGNRSNTRCITEITPRGLDLLRLDAASNSDDELLKRIDAAKSASENRSQGDTGVKLICSWIVESMDAVVALSPDSKYAICGVLENVMVWQPQTGAMKFKLEGHKSHVTSVASSLDAGLAASGDDSGIICVWDLATGQFKAALQGHSKRVSSIAFAPNGKTLVSGSWDGSLRVWNLAGKKCTGILNGHETEVSAVAISPCGSVAISGGFDRTVRLWELNTGKCSAVLPGHDDKVAAVAIAGNGKKFTSGAIDGRTLISTLPPTTVKRSGKLPRGISSIAISSDGRKQFLALNDGTVVLHEEGSSGLIVLAECPGRLPSHVPLSTKIQLSADEKGLLVARAGGIGFFALSGKP
jgi:WD40 repeat protein